MLVKNLLLFILISLVLFSCKSNNTKEAKDDKDKITKSEFTFASPEGIISDGHFFYVSNVGKRISPTDKDGDGYILKLDGDMNIIEKFSASAKLDAPKGMGIINGKLYVNDIDKVVVFKIENGMVLDKIKINIDSNTFLNDIAIKDTNTLYVSNPIENSIYEIDIQNKKYQKLNIIALKGPNGLFYCNNKNRLWVVETGSENKPDGRILMVYPEEERYDIVDGFTGNFDGVKLLINDNLLISDWATNNFYRLSLKSGNLTKITLETIDNHGDFFYDDSTRTLYSTKVKENDVVKMKVEDTTSN